MSRKQLESERKTVELLVGLVLGAAAILFLSYWIGTLTVSLIQQVWFAACLVFGAGLGISPGIWHLRNLSKKKKEAGNGVF